ncbi:MAG TPA: mersacidin/lichenicidin family type 2 lantibiotic [Thermoanaerobaculia bacterium]
MKKPDVARAWRNYDRYRILTEEERTGLGEHPAGPETAADDVLHSLTGGRGPGSTQTSVVTACVFNDEDTYCN